MISVVIPALNEAENLTVLVPRVVSALVGLPGDWRVLVVDDGSTDDTTAVVAKLSAEDARVSLLQHRRNLGGHAIACP